MSKGIAAMSFLPKTLIELVSGSADQSTKAIRAFLFKVAELQADNITLDAVNVICNGNSPYANSTWEVSAKVPATGSINFENALAGSTVTVNGLVYTAVAGTKADNTEFSIDGDNLADAADLADSINNDTREGTVPTGVVANQVSTSVNITAVDGGVESNAITLASSNGSTLAVSAATLEGGKGYVGTFQEEVSNLSDDAKGRTALSTRRLIDVEIDVDSEPTYTFNVRSVLAALNFIEKLEDKVAQTGDGSTGDGTYTDVVLKGATPYESFTWTITKSGNDYSLEPTANS